MNNFELNFNIDSAAAQPSNTALADNSVAPAQIDAQAANEDITDQTPATSDDSALNARIRDDIKHAQANLQNLSFDDRRCLEDDTLQHFSFGYSARWNSPKAPNTLPTARIIAPLGDRGTPAYNAILTNSDRQRVKNSDHWEYQKCLTAGSKLVFNPDGLKKSIVVITEGEFDAASLWQAAQRGKIINAGDEANFTGFVALGGAGQFTDLIRRLSALDAKPKVVILFDNDAPGRKDAEELRKRLWDIGVVAVVAFLDDVMTDDDKKAVGGKIDANAILQQFGNDKLYRIFARVVKHACKDFKAAEAEMQAFQAAREAEKCDDGRPRDLSPEIEALIAKVKDEVPISRLVDKGYLQHSKNGDAHPDGYCCLWCGSGTGTHKTGALTIYNDDKEPHVTCHACGKGGDVLTVYAKVKGLSLYKADFFTTLKELCDEFSVDYDLSTSRAD